MVDVGVCAALTVAAIVLTHGLLAHPATRTLALNPGDQDLVEWLLALGPRFWAGDLHLVTTLLNAPDGINLLSNASMLGLGIPLAPVTVLFGAPAAFAVAVTVNLAATGVAWYLLLSRTLALHRAAAATGAAFCAYAPGMIAQSNAHPHMTAQWLVPVVVWAVVRLARAGRQRLAPIVWTGGVLGVVVSAQLFIGEEVLFLTAATLGLFILGYVAAAPRRAARMALPVACGALVAVAVAVALLGYPLAVQFTGPQHVPNGAFSPSFFGADLAGYWTWSPLSLGGNRYAEKLVSGPAEYNAFFGVPLLVVVLAAVAWLWRRPAVLAATAAGLVMAAIALGPTISVGGTPTSHSGPYRLIAGLPVIDGALPTRFSLVLIPIIGYVLAVALDRARHDDRQVVRWVVPAVLSLALLPLVPRPLPTADRPPVPRFFTSGAWRGCVRPGGTLVPVPLPDASDPDTMRWPAAADDRFGIPQGFFIGPYAAGGRASVGIFARPTSQLLSRVALTGVVAPVSAADRAQATADVAYWHASCLVMADQQPRNGAQLRQTVEALFGPGRHVSDVTVWQPAGG